MKELKQSDYNKAAFILGVPVNNLMAVAQVESAGAGFLYDGQPKILFEGHKFRSLTGGKYDKDYSDISHPYGDPNRRKYYQLDQHSRLRRAIKLDREAALMSASWGRFQVLAMNWKDLGYESVQQFVNAMYRNEAGHLDSFVRFVVKNKIVDALRAGDFDKFARVYNGPDYKANKYDQKMRQYAVKFKDFRIWQC